MSDDASTLTFTWATATDTGRHRSINQDSVLAAPGLFVVADGMGGASGGEVASATAPRGWQPLSRSLTGRTKNHILPAAWRQDCLSGSVHSVFGRFFRLHF